MNRIQRSIVIVYCLLFTYCGLWVPWHYKLSEKYGNGFVRTGYGWLWSGPNANPNIASFDVLRSTPDGTIMLLRIAVITAIGIAAFLLTEFNKSSKR